MEYELVLAFDMDDTLCNTQQEVVKRATGFCMNNMLVDEAVHLMENPGIAFDRHDGKLGEVILEEVIKKRVYMDTAEPTELMMNLGWLLERVRKEFAGRIKVVICTHRGDNMEAWLSSYNYLKKCEVEGLVDMIHSIDHEINSNKLDYLERMYPGSRILLVDDNPFGSKSKIRPFDSRVLMYDGVMSYDCHINQSTYLGHFDLYDQVCHMLD